MAIKFCVFCGEKPESKTKEHVIPRWLIEHTGAPERLANFGFDFETKKFRQFAYDSFVFPACSDCNEHFSKLEGDTQKIVIKLLNEKSIESEEWSLLLAWFDKVRIGLWLGFLYLNNNQDAISPKFHINSRLNQADRMLLIYKLDSDGEGVGFSGVGYPPFDFVPSCIGLRINQYYFVNVSMQFLFSRRLGLPYPNELMIENDDGTVICPVADGRRYQMRPLLRTNYNRNCTQIFQPIVSVCGLEDDDEQYNSEYVLEYVNIRDSKIGKVLIQNNDRVEIYSDEHNLFWIPSTIIEENMINKECVKTVFGLQNYLMDTYLSTYNCSDFQRKFVNSLKNFNRKMERLIDRSN